MKLREEDWRVFASCKQQVDCDRLRTMGFEAPRIDYTDTGSIHQGLNEVLEATDGTLDALFNNGAHDSVGGQPTVAHQIDIPAIADAVGYAEVLQVKTADEIHEAMLSLKNVPGPSLLEIKVKKGFRKDLGRPTKTPIENKTDLMRFIR